MGPLPNSVRIDYYQEDACWSEKEKSKNILESDGSQPSV